MPAASPSGFWAGLRNDRRQRAVLVDGGAADFGVDVVETEVFTLGNDLEDTEGLRHDLGSDVVSGEDGELERGHKG